MSPRSEVRGMVGALLRNAAVLARKKVREGHRKGGGG